MEIQGMEIEEVGDKTVPVHLRPGDFSIPLLLPFPPLPLLPRRMVRARCLPGALIVLGAILTFAPILSAQIGMPSRTTQAPAWTPAPTPALSHDLSGVWMQYPDGDVPGVPGMNAVSNRTRPPLTPWGKAKFDAAKPLVGPRAVPGVENNPELRCEPDGPPKQARTDCPDG